MEMTWDDYDVSQRLPYEGEHPPILDTRIQDDVLIITFLDNTYLKVWDGGQSCCEHRSMECPDLPRYTGARFISLDVRDGPETPDGEYGGCVESQFLELRTSQGFSTICNYNSHNGYYGGFSLRLLRGEVL